MVVVPLLPRAIDSFVGLAAIVNVPKGVTVSVIVVLAVAVPVGTAATPVMVTVEVPGFAFGAAVKLTVLEFCAGFGLKLAVTPAGSPEAENATFPENPFTGVMAIVAVPADPCGAVTALGVAESVNH